MPAIRLGKIMDLEIRIDFSWFIILALILWTLAKSYFPIRHPGLAYELHLLMGTIGALLFLASLLAHELAHARVARARGTPVEGITLFVFGGLARTRKEAGRPGDELLIAAVGPLASLLLAGCFGFAGWLGLRLGWSDAVVGLAEYLALINALIAVLHMLPGFPLDGGRLFRAAAWKLTGDLTTATRWATTGGRWIAAGLVAFGILQLFLDNVVSGLWLVFIGWFVHTTSDDTFTQHVLLRTVVGVRVREVMTADPETVSPHLPIPEFIERHVLHGRHRAFPVVDGERLLGLVTLARLRDIPRELWPHRNVADVMLPLQAATCARPGDRLSEVIERLASTEDGRVLVTSNGHLEGVITRSDLIRWLERVRLLRPFEARREAEVPATLSRGGI
jgi:Zn-dependent protease/CBS domain-containing protein